MLAMTKVGQFNCGAVRFSLTETSRIESNTGNSNGGNITIESDLFSLEDKAAIVVSSQGEGTGGNLQLTATDSVEIMGAAEPVEFLGKLVFGFAKPSDLNKGLYSVAFSNGNGGDLTIDTQRLTINRALAATLTVFSGTSGSLTANAADSMNIIGQGSDPLTLLSNIGDIADRKLLFPAISELLNLIDSGLLSASVGDGNAGDTTINTGNLTVTNGGFLASVTLGKGSAGALNVNASESARIENRSGLVAATLGAGNAGNVTIAAPEVTIINKSVISADTAAEGNGGQIAINTNRFLADEEANISASTIATPFGRDGQGGSIAIDASESVELLEESGLLSQSLSNGDAGNITINTGRLIIRAQADRTGMTTGTLGAGSGGDIIINASESVEILGGIEETLPVTEENIQRVLANNKKLVGMATIAGGDGDAGNVTINTGRFIVRNGGGIITSTAGNGLGGNLTIRASESVELTGFAVLSTSTLGEGNGGNLTLETERLIVQDGAAISGDAFGLSDALIRFGFDDDVADFIGDSANRQAERAFNGNAGDLTITAGEIRVLDGSRIGAATGIESLGSGGNLTLRASDFIEVTGISADGGQVPSGIFANTTGAGDAGNLTIESNKLTVRDGAQLTVAATQENTAAGNLDIFTNSTRLDAGTITAETRRDNSGNINIQTNDIALTDGSNINTDARGTATGGNISINTDNLVAIENSDISANAEQDFGGRVTIDATGIFGTEFRENPTPDSDITATSELGPAFSGTVEINTPDIDPTSGLVELAENVEDVDQPALGCQATGSSETELFITGRGGMRPNPLGILDGSGTVEDLRIPDSSEVLSSEKPGFWHPRVEPDGLEQPIASAPDTSPLSMQCVGLETEVGLETKPLQGGNDRTVTISDIRIQSDGRLSDDYITSRLELDRVRSRGFSLAARSQGFSLAARSQGFSLLGAYATTIDRLGERLQLLQLDPLIESISAELSADPRQNGAAILEINIKESPSFNSFVTLDNGRSPSAGSFRRQVGGSQANLFTAGDRLSLAYTNTDGSNTANASYLLPVNRHGGTLEVNYSRGWSQVVEPPFDRIDIEANSIAYGLSYRQPVLRTLSDTVVQELALGLRGDAQDSQTSILGQNYPLSPGANDDGETRIRALRFFQDWTRRSDRQVLAARSEFSLGLGLFDATVNDRAPDSQFFSWRGQGQLVRLLAPDTLLLVRGDLQLATGSLVPLEQFSLGGFQSVRGYRQDALLTDNGALASVELRLPIYRSPGRRAIVQLSPFLDLGAAWNSDGKANPDTKFLAATGLGLRLQLGDRFTARVDWGIPLVNVNDSRNRTWQENGFYFSVETIPFSF
jgi:hemolysin activation/secretion protein/large exoprotein involved in heme utilization and adhesion